MRVLEECGFQNKFCLQEPELFRDLENDKQGAVRSKKFEIKIGGANCADPESSNPGSNGDGWISMTVLIRAGDGNGEWKLR
jgi:hypothetical protein